MPESDVEDDLPPPTAPSGFPIRCNGFGEADTAERFAQILGDVVVLFSRAIDLERLDGITVAFDYNQALADLDRGYASSTRLTATRSSELVGVAMSPAVIREGQVKCHMVFNAAHILPLENPDNEHSALSTYLVAHECGHVQDLKFRDMAFPGTILQRPFDSQMDAILDSVFACWDEYAACRASAIFGRGHTPIYEESFTSTLSVARTRANEAIRAYRQHHDINRVLVEAGGPLCEPLRTASYLLGHLDGLGQTFDDVPTSRDCLADSPYGPFVSRLHTVLSLLWARRGQWQSLAEFDPLKEIGRDALAAGGLTLRPMPDGRVYVDVPFRPETI